jgi:hypothetical protein
MRPDQLVRLNELSDMLADVLIEEIDPREWPGAGAPLASLSKEDRGDRYWCKKNAAATLMLVGKVGELTKGALLMNYDADDSRQLDDDIKQAEKEASKLLAQLQDTAGKTEFSKRAYGKT